MLNKRLFSSTALLFFLIVAFGSCMTKKKMARLKEDYQMFRTNMDSLGTVEKWEERKFRPGDKVLVSIKTQSLNDQQLAFFEGGKEMEFAITDDSTIALPLIGKINACLYNRPQLTNIIKSKAAHFIKDPFVLIKPVQIQVKVLGQVERQGLFTIPENDATLISLLAQVGGVSQFARRDSIAVIREDEGVRRTYYVDIQDGKSFFNSPIYRLQQNDIVVIQPNDYFFKYSRNQENTVNLGRLTPIMTVLTIVFFILPVYSLFRR